MSSTLHYYNAKTFAEKSNLEYGTIYLLRKLNILPKNLEKIVFRDANKKSIVLTTEGKIGTDQPQLIRIPTNLYDFSPNIVLPLLLHECIHVEQKSGIHPIFNKNEREFICYHENICQVKYPFIPKLPNYLAKNFAKKALEYYGRLDPLEDRAIIKKYTSEVHQLNNFLNSIK